MVSNSSYHFKRGREQGEGKLRSRPAEHFRSHSVLGKKKKGGGGGGIGTLFSWAGKKGKRGRGKKRYSDSGTNTLAQQAFSGEKKEANGVVAGRQAKGKGGKTRFR